MLTLPTDAVRIAQTIWMPRAKKEPFDLKDACVLAARDVIAERGVEGWSMRDVARKLEISHQAPYRHFASRDHLLAEIMRRCFADFADHLDRHRESNPADDELDGMGGAYLAYADAHPFEYRLMFGTPWPEPAQHPELVRYALHAFDILRQSLRRKHGEGAVAKVRADLDALFIWSALHGMASIRQSPVMAHLALAPGVKSRFKEELMRKIEKGLEAQPFGGERRSGKPS